MKLKKVWAWLKHNWYVPAVLLAVLIATLLGGKKQKTKLERLLKVRTDNHKKEVEIINKANKTELKKHHEADIEFQAEVEELEREHKEQTENLKKEKGTEYKKLLKKHEDDPDGQAKAIAELFGLQYIPPIPPEEQG